MKPSKPGEHDSALGDSDLVLNLPDAPDFVSQSPILTAEALFALCQSRLPFHNRQPGQEMRRLKRRPRIPFSLLGS